MGYDSQSEPGWAVHDPELYSSEHQRDADLLPEAVRRKHSSELLDLLDCAEPGSVAMTNFEERVLRDLGELKTHMRWIVGNGNEGKIQELEMRIQKHEAALQRTAGIGAAVAVLFTVVHLALESLRTIHR